MEAAVEEVAPTVEAAVEEIQPTVEAAVEEVTGDDEDAAAEEEEEAAEEEAMAELSCEEPIKVGLITDEAGQLAIYGAHMLRSFPLGLEYATGAPGVEGDGYTS